MSSQDFLLELGSEELPPKALPKLELALKEQLIAGLQAANLSFNAVQSFATPRRLAVLVSGLSSAQPDQAIERRGPAVASAYKDGQPTQAALGFAASCGVQIDELETLETPKGSWLMFRSSQKGQATVDLLPALAQQVLTNLPVPKNMRWGASRTEFSRPVHWLVMLFGQQIVPAQILGLNAGRTTFGHRFHAPAAIEITAPSSYAEQLLQAKVIADFQQRQEIIRTQVLAEAEKHQAQAVIDASLLEEVTGLVEWPAALTGSFDAEFLQLPAACLISSMQANQKYFHFLNSAGELLPLFTTIANIESKQPELVVAGNEKVIRPRLADAAFFFDTDKKTPLAARFANLEEVVFQHQLGSLADKSRRISNLAVQLGAKLGAQAEHLSRAAYLAKCDLNTGMVLEFPELQGIMGEAYANFDGEPAAVSLAIREHYLPRNPQDKLPTSPVGISLALADRLDTLTGIFGLGLKPTGVRDPFALRRAALAVLNILVNLKLDLDLRELIQLALAEHKDLPQAAKVEQELLDYMLDRFRALYQSQGLATELFLAVRGKNVTNPYDFDRRVQAVASFSKLAESKSLAAASKRVNNLLNKTPAPADLTIQESLFETAEEQKLAQSLAAKQQAVAPLYAAGDYAAALHTLADLREVVDNFFDKVRVIADDAAVKNNRLALLANLQALFMHTADIAQLPD